MVFINFSQGKYIAGDEQTITFKWDHVDKLWVNLKKKGSGLKVDAICDDGYTLWFYFYYGTDPENYLKELLSPLHSHIFDLLYWLDKKGLCVGMDNLYNSLKYAKACYKYIKRYLCMV